MHNEIGQSVLANLEGVAPDFARLIFEFPFGDIYARPGLDLRSRQIATLSALTALGITGGTLEAHIEAGLNVGLTRVEIVEVLMQMAVYAGFPRALDALLCAKTVFARRDQQAAATTQTGVAPREPVR
jgi:4-carboxymuconolactone decarboxylase